MNAELRRLASSVVVTGLRNEDLDDDALSAYPFGGYVIFDRNAPTLAALRAFTDRLRARYGDLAPIVAIDQEGGRVMRLREGIAPLPAAATLGASGDERLAYATGARCAYDLRRAGCNLDLAPVVDLALDPANAVIGDRSFGADPALVTRMGRAFAQGLASGGVVATFKHFPGHGATAVDSHDSLPVISADERTLRARDLVPFAQLAREAPAFMAGHLVVEAWDASAPASLSTKILQGLLRDELGFTGVCFTDCLQMAAVASGIGSVEGGVRALRAGADALTISHDVRLSTTLVDRIASAVEENVLSVERLREAAQRVSELRARLSPPLPV